MKEVFDLAILYGLGQTQSWIAMPPPVSEGLQRQRSCKELFKVMSKSKEQDRFFNKSTTNEKFGQNKPQLSSLKQNLKKLIWKFI